MLLQILFKVLKIQTTIKGIKDDKGKNWYVMKGWEIKKGKKYNCADKWAKLNASQ